MTVKPAAPPAHSKVLILDFGSQYTQVIARRIRELQVYSEIVPFNISAAQVEDLQPKGIILSGGPASVYEKNAPQIDPKIFALGIPVLGICYASCRWRIISAVRWNSAAAASSDRACSK